MPRDHLTTDLNAALDLEEHDFADDLRGVDIPASRLGIVLVWGFVAIMSILIWIALAAALVRLAGR